MQVSKSEAFVIFDNHPVIQKFRRMTVNELMAAYNGDFGDPRIDTLLAYAHSIHASPAHLLCASVYATQQIVLDEYLAEIARGNSPEMEEE